MLSSLQIKELAEGMLTARHNRMLVAPPTMRYDVFSELDAYAVALALRHSREQSGERVVGMKIGFTNSAVWSQYGLDHPIAAPMYDTTVSFAQTIQVGSLIAPRIEPEIVFGIGNGGVAWHAFGLEIVQSHYLNWKFGPLDAIVDFGLHAALVVGERHPLGTNAEDAMASFTIALECDGETVAEGGGVNVLGSPLRSLARLQELIQRAEVFSLDETTYRT